MMPLDRDSYSVMYKTEEAYQFDLRIGRLEERGRGTECLSLRDAMWEIVYPLLVLAVPYSIYVLARLSNRNKHITVKATAAATEIIS